VAFEAWSQARQDGDIYDSVKKRWYAHISVKVPLEGRSVGGGFMGIDLGRESAGQPLSRATARRSSTRAGVLKSTTSTSREG
jgi:hypothetical protein